MKVDEAIEILKKSLYPGEKVMLLGTPIEPRMASSAKLVIIVICVIPVVMLAISMPSIAAGILCVIALIVIGGSRGVITDAESFLVLTNDRLLQVTLSGVTDICFRNKIIKIDSRREGESVHITTPDSVVALKAIKSLPEIRGED
jgi:hypothetical protein